MPPRFPPLVASVGAISLCVLIASCETSATAQPTPANVCALPGFAATADALAATFDAHQFVYVASTHGDAKIDAFLGCLVTRPAFTSRVTDIVTEWASFAQQRLMDRFFLNLDSIPVDSLAPIWLDTDTPNLWTTLPNLREFVQTLRDVNRTLAPEKRIRLIGGNDPTDWSKVRAVEDLAPYPFKTNLMPHLIVEHLANTRGNRTLVIYGDGHIRHNSPTFMSEIDDALGRAKSFVVGTIHELSDDNRSYVATVGDTNSALFIDAARFPRLPMPGALRVRLDEDENRLSDYIDGILYLGPEKSRITIGAIPLTEAQRRELARRSSIMGVGETTIRVRYQSRAKWFAGHPNDFWSRPP